MTKILSPLGTLSILSLAIGVHVVVRSASAGTTLPEADLLILKFVMPLVLVLWLHTDYRQSRYWPCFEYDLLVLVAWPVTLLHYLVHTRGARGLWLYVGLWGLFLFPGLCLGVATAVAGVRGLRLP